MDVFEEIEKYLTAVEDRKRHQIKIGKVNTDKTGKLKSFKNIYTDELTSLRNNADYSG
jgi:hypothetical protein